MQVMDCLTQSASANESSDDELLKPALPVVELNDDCLDYSKRYLDPNNYLLYEFRFALDVLLSSKTVQSTSDELTKALCNNDFFDWLLDNPVKLSYFIDLRQDKLVKLLHELLPVCSPNEWNSDLQTWLYAALLALEKPLHPNTCSLLRNIAEQFCEHLQVKEFTEDTESNEKRFCYIILSIIGIAFGQRDIIEDL
nr:survival of motor neuron protein interacting [Hymenolepis microstoma]